MSDDVKNDVNGEPNAPQDLPNDSPSGDVDLSRMRVEDMTQEQLRTSLLATRGEAGTRRKTVAEVQTELRMKDKELAELRAGQEKQLRDQGEFEELSEQLSVKLERLEAVEEEAKRYRESVEAANKKALERLPEHMRSIVPVNYSPDQLSEWLSDNVSKLTAAPIPDMNGGAGGVPGRSNQRPKLTDDEKIAAARMRMSEEEYAAQKP